MQDSEELVIAGTGDIHIGPVGSPLPITPTEEVGVAFHTVGFTNQDGVALTYTPEVTDFGAWQKRSPVRRELTAVELQLAFSMLQWSGSNFALAFGGGEITETDSGVYRYDYPSADSALAEVASIADFADGDKHYRIVVPRSNVTDAVETTLNRAALGELPVALKALEPDNEAIAYLLTDDPAFAPEGS